MLNMGQEFDKISKNLAMRLTELRSKRNLTQEALAKLADVPRSTIANLESGTGNPSLINLTKISEALSIPIEQLLSPSKAVCKKFESQDLKKLSRSSGEVLITKLLPDPVVGMEIDKIEVNPKAKMRGIPHASGTKEYFHCLSGEFIVTIENEMFHLNKGDVLTFPGETHHSYENPSKTKSTGISVVVFAPIEL